ncbi:tRNA preQ1(34) S-adenosylmethionine ribosyltransferase-isomerase QueA [Alphaproteobacteria bacterium]|nr:tRNA preQ1(34) S-adenosylmethionine ribosyltransferase-isomerase QueA [Alphaproteobacteria bacterium]
MELKDFNYKLPRDLIAQEPASPRSSSKILIAEKNLISTFKRLHEHLSSNDVLIINNTKVIPAVIIGTVNNKNIKITLHSKISSKVWIAFSKPSKLLNTGNIIVFSDKLTATVLKKNQAHVQLLFNLEESNFYKYLKNFGKLPIPPYIKKIKNKEENEKNYQSVFSKKFGAYASPTASLHFDDLLLSNLKRKNIDIIEVTLHVGAGTFLPLENNVVELNKLHKEKGYISFKNAQKINQSIKNKKNIVAVGTTVLRLLEDCYQKYSKIKYYNEEADLFIFPGFKFNVVDRLITNFHLPKSSLLLLVSAFGGKKNINKYYNNAIKNKMRFYSYGDGMIINRKK